jgi:hypothetical protein
MVKTDDDDDNDDDDSDYRGKRHPVPDVSDTIMRDR